MIRAVVFDLWNTLVHSRHGDPFRHLQRLLDDEQKKRYPELRREAMDRPHPDARTFLAGWMDRLSLSGTQMLAMAEVFQTAADDAAWFPEALEAVEGTRKLARVGLLSNTQSFDMEFLERLGLERTLPTRCLSAHTGHLKPEPGAFRHMEKRLGLFPGEIAMVGDSWRDDVTGALEAGWTAIWVNRPGHPRPGDVPGEDLVEIPDLSLVPRVVENLQKGARCGTCLG
ncbi:HAD family hydrolase [Mesoterricola silvestris]|uniref:HAD family hydrolase n=1 Tax=Mesoterricola silvestris TaxID=2927979 RepID=A0AA48GER8_9BACT|nr:HAD family hydrolase [Mesoterricola silvestris]BDU71201.1 HAD family hydrolase [Mesoterricola silvestris]